MGTFQKLFSNKGQAEMSPDELKETWLNRREAGQLGAFLGNIQKWLGRSKPKPQAAPTKPKPVPAGWDQKKWEKKAIDALVTRDMPKEDREKFYDFNTKKAERLALVQKYMPSKGDICLLYTSPSPRD